MEVMAYGAVISSIKDPDSTSGEGSSERSMIGRREGDSCIIYDTPFQPFVKREIMGRHYLHNTRHTAAACNPLNRRLLLLPQQRGRDKRSVCSQGSRYLSWGRCCIGMWM